MTKQLIPIVLLFSFLLSGSVEASAISDDSSSSQIPSQVALRVLIGEAGDQGLKGMICVGEVLRKRGSIRGFRGYRAKHIKDTPASIWKQAALAWERSAHTNFTNGADHFENVRRFGQPKWAKGFTKTYEYKDHVFYKSRLSFNRR